MTVDYRRRRLLAGACGVAGFSAFGSWPALASPAQDPFSDAPFSFDRLVDRARHLAALPYEAPEAPHAKLLAGIGYEQFMGIHARHDRALWRETKRPFAVEFFHPDKSSPLPVALYVVEHGRARRLTYDPALFRFDDPALARRMPRDLGLAGFRLVDNNASHQEWLAFKGASYFRSPAPLDQYGLSARGVAVDTGLDHAESFPRFSAFWLFPPAPDSDTMTVCALLEGKRITGAYRMRCRRTDGVRMDIESQLFARTGIRRLGIAPLTSMFWFSETNARRGSDWRPEIHDSDGLAITTGRGEQLWRALDNPPRPNYSVFADHNPRGFGLVQRDRAFDHYQDAAVYYDRRPSLWVEPAGAWGDGHIGLFELPTAEEVYDNINAFWIPGGDTPAGRAWRFDYRLFWCDTPPRTIDLARVVATRTGRAGKPGTYDEQPPLARKFVIDFAGDALARLENDDKPEIDAGASHGRIQNPYVTPVGATGRWRAFFDWRGQPPADNAPVELRCRLTRDATALTETWLMPYFPQPLPPRVAD